MRNVIKIVSFIIILLGLVHTYFAFFCRYMDIDTLWFLGSGFAIIFAGLLNFVALDRGGSKFTNATALITNALMCVMFCFALPLIHGPQVFIGTTIFMITAAAFLIRIVQQTRS